VTVDHGWGLTSKTSLARCALTKLGAGSTYQLKSLRHFYPLVLDERGISTTFIDDCCPDSTGTLAQLRQRAAGTEKATQRMDGLKATPSITALDFSLALAVVTPSLAGGGGLALAVMFARAE
jgi:hypothetical protein